MSGDTGWEFPTAKREFDSSDDIIYIMANACYNLKQYDEVKKYLEPLINRNPKYYNAYILSGKIYTEEHNDEGFERLVNLAKTNFSDPPVYYAKK